MKIIPVILVVALAVAVGAAVTGWNKAGEFQRQLESLRAEMKSQADKAAAEAASAKDKHAAELQKLKADAQEVVRLRGEVTQLKANGRDVEKAREATERARQAAEQKLAAANQARAAASSAAGNAAPPAEGLEIGKNLFPRETWSNAGYASPEAAMVSAMWAMNTGDPKAYFESLTPTEQARVLKSWEGKTEQEIAAKHVSDAARVSSLSVVNRQAVSDSEMWLTVSAPNPDGTARTMLVPMYQIDGAWKFGGFQRPSNPNAPKAAR